MYNAEVQKKSRDYGIKIGTMIPGPGNSITDVAGVTVGHVTLDEGSVKTGVTAILPHGGNIFNEKILAAAHVINGFGKSQGLVQVEEMGTIETPIILTNTLRVGVAYRGLVEYMLAQNPAIGKEAGTVNPLIGECNDSFLNDIRGCHVKKEHIIKAIEAARQDFKQGSVGAGTGMTCYGLKGGIGSASRLIEIDANQYTLAALVLSNFGRKKDLLIDGIKAGLLIEEYSGNKSNVGHDDDKGSIIVVLATDVPLSERQLKRLCKRSVIGIVRTGSYLGTGSGDIVVGFTTANKIFREERCGVTSIKVLNENNIDTVFRAAGESVEEAILNSLFCAEPKTGRDGHSRDSIHKYLDIVL